MPLSAATFASERQAAFAIDGAVLVGRCTNGVRLRALHAGSCH